MYRTLLRPILIHINIMHTNCQSNRGISIKYARRYKKRQCMDSQDPNYDSNRRWVSVLHTNEHLVKRPSDDKINSFKLVSYNILAQDLLVEHLFLYLKIEQQFLTWDRRLQNIHREILKLDPDILCLQEMQYNHLPQLVQRLSASNGKRLEYVYKKKTGHRTDGCAIIYDSSRFQLIKHHGLELYTKNIQLLNRENIALFAKFRLKQADTANEVVVATTHLLYNPKRDDVRCAQLGKIMNALRTFASDKNSNTITTPIVLTGDLNSTPSTQPIEFLTRKPADETNELSFKNICQSDISASTFQDEWINVDYILHSINTQCQSQLMVKSIYALPTVNCCYRVGPIPNYYLGSDHYAMGAVFGLF